MISLFCWIEAPLLTVGCARCGVEPYGKCPLSNHQSQQGIQIFGYHISIDAVIRDKIFNTQNNEFFYWRKNVFKKKYTEKEKENNPTQHFCVAEDCMLLEGGVLYGFTGPGAAHWRLLPFLHSLSFLSVSYKRFIKCINVEHPLVFWPNNIIIW